MSQSECELCGEPMGDEDGLFHQRCVGLENYLADREGYADEPERTDAPGRDGP